MKNKKIKKRLDNKPLLCYNKDTKEMEVITYDDKHYYWFSVKRWLG